MKTKLNVLLVLIAFATISNVASAQKMPFFQLGVKGGANLTKIGGESFSDGFKLGYHLGGYAILKLSDRIQLQPEVLFNQFNTKTSEDFGSIGDPNNLKDVSLNYLTIPLLIDITTIKVLSVQLGAQYGILMNNAEDLTQNGRDAFNKGDFSALAGVQINLAGIKLGARYMIGLDNISNLPYKDSWKNQGVQVSFGFKVL